MGKCQVCGDRGNIGMGGALLCNIHAEEAQVAIARWREAGARASVSRYIVEARTNELTTLNIRNIDPDAAARAKRAAQARGMTLGQYVAALVSLHDVMRGLADTPTSNGRWEQVQAQLAALGLQTVSG